MTEETQPQKSGTKAILTCANFVGKVRPEAKRCHTYTSLLSLISNIFY